MVSDSFQVWVISAPELLQSFRVRGDKVEHAPAAELVAGVRREGQHLPGLWKVINLDHHRIYGPP